MSGKTMNSDTTSKGFQLNAILRLFELKSVVSKEKCLYYFLLKALKNGAPWAELSN